MIAPDFEDAENIKDARRITPALEPANQAEDPLKRRLLLRRFWKGASGFWLKGGGRLSWVLPATILATVLLSLATSYGINIWNRAIFDALERRDAGTVVFWSVVYFPLLAASLTNGARDAALAHWRDSSGNLAVWLMNGAASISTGGLGNVGSTPTIASQRDFNGDGRYDLLWRDTSSARRHVDLVRERHPHRGRHPLARSRHLQPTAQRILRRGGLRRDGGTRCAGSSPQISARKTWQRDALEYVVTCREKRVPAALERSRSGNGAHVWIIFSEPVPASDARKFGPFGYGDDGALPGVRVL
jgi:hypothetical protein